MRVGIVLAGLIIAQVGLASSIEDLYANRDYTGQGLQSIQQYSDHYQQALGKITQVDMMRTRQAAINALNAKGITDRSVFDAIDDEIQNLISVELRDHSQTLNEVLPIINYAKAQYFLGESAASPDVSTKAGFFQKCFSITDLSLRAHGFIKWHKFDPSMKKQFNDFDAIQSSQLAEMIFLRTSCLGSWVTSGIVSMFEGAARIGELIDSAKLVIETGYSSAGHFGLHRVWAKIASNSPMKRFGKDLKKGVELMQEAFEKTRRGHAVSIYGWNNTFYADSLFKLAAADLKKGKRDLKKGLRLIDGGKTEEGIGFIRSGQQKIKSGEDMNSLAKSILDQYIATDLKTLGSANYVENLRAQQEAQTMRTANP